MMCLRYFRWIRVQNCVKKYGIPTAAYEIFDDMDKAIAYLQDKDMPIVIKADGLALGKGVIIAQTLAEAEEAVRSMMADKVFGASGDHVVIEEFLTGPEVSVLALTDGKTLVPMVSSMDHKRAHDNDEGLNTGGMGTVAPNPYYTADIADVCMETIFLPTMNAMNTEGRTFKAMNRNIFHGHHLSSEDEWYILRPSVMSTKAEKPMQ